MSNISTISNNVQTLMTHELNTLRDMQDNLSCMFDEFNNGGIVSHTLPELQQMEHELSEAVGRIAFSEDYDDMQKYMVIWENGEKLYQKIRWGGKLKLISWSGDLMVDVELKDEAGVKFLGVKHTTDKRYRGHFAKSANEIENYLSQFRIR